MKLTLTLALMLLLACSEPSKEKTYRTIGGIERIDPEINAIIDSNAVIEIIAEGFEWSEGPVWLEKQQKLLFSDVPKNTIHAWSEEKGTEVYLTPSGYTGNTTRGGETGSNGLQLMNDSLVLCQHGNRQVAVMNAPLDAPKSDFRSLANQYNRKKFNSPNDLVIRSNGDVFFTDPPYGLEKGMDDSTKETPFQGVYKVSGGRVTLMVDSITRPNGIAFTPDEKVLIVANSDPAKPFWYAYDVTAGDSLINARIHHDASAAAKTEKGLPDGLKIDKQGYVFASGPGGLWIFNKNGKLIGKCKIPEATSNCALSADEKTLYITSDMYVLRIRMRK
ncbi:MAG TPA: SMP-30/gluconolactonase/LRE family protein [Chitinophagaceae bacterium]|nr:SMP-30/gluconolactonase/LRE family protein [Chitinophagaceae bacterium]